MLLARLFRSLDAAPHPAGSAYLRAPVATKRLLERAFSAPRSQRGGVHGGAMRSAGGGKPFGIIPAAGVIIP